MAGYDDTRNKILETLLQRPVGTEIQPENHQDFALSLLDYIRSVELISGSTLIGIAYQDTVPVQSNDANEAYIAGVAQERTVVFQNFRDVNGDPLTVTTEEMEAKLVILIWNKQYWSKQEISANIVSQAENAYYFYNLTIRKQYASVAAMNADKVSPMGNDGRVIKRGEIVSVRNPSNSDEDAVYSYELDAEGNPSWVLQMKLSALATRTIDGGSASVKLDTVQNKRDTKANWEANNPVLAEGEIGLVLDDKNSYKVGDGVTKWNDLPLRGYNGNVVSEFGDDFNSVMSQGGITNLLKYIVGNDNKIEIGTSNFDVLDNVKMAGFYVLTTNGFPAYHMLITFDNMVHCFNQWIFGNLVLTNGTITDGAHTDGTFNIICRTYSLRTHNAGSDNVEITAGTWTKWRYLQSFFLRDKDGNIGNEEKTFGEGAIENKITVLQNNIIQLVDDLESDFNDKILDVEGDYDYLLLEYQKLIVWAGKLEDAINVIVTKYDADIASVDNRLTELEKSQFPLTVTTTLSSTLLEYTGVAQTVVVSYNVKRKGAPVVPESLKAMVDNIITILTAASTGSYNATVNKDGSTSVAIQAVKDGMTATETKIVQMVRAMYFGFSPYATASAVAADKNILSKQAIKTSPAGSYTLTNSMDGSYLWLCIPDNMTINKVTLNGFDVPMESVVTIDRYKYYRSSNRLTNKDYTFVIS